MNMALITGERFNSTTIPFWDAPVVDYATVKKKSQQPSPDSYIIDVREPDEVAQGSIPSSVSVPLSKFGKSFNMAAIDFKEAHGFEKPGKAQEVVVYCRSGKRSATAGDILKKKGYTNVKNYSGSWLDWVAQEQEHQKKGHWDDDD